MTPGGFYRLLRAGILGFGALMAIVMIIAGLTQYPKAAAELADFKNDAGCVAGFAAVASGRCKVVDAVTVSILPRSQSDRSNSQGNVEVRYAGGRTETIYLGGRSGGDFTHAVYPDDPVKVQVFAGHAVAVEGHEIVAETTLSPAIRAASARTMPIVGVLMLMVIGVIWWFLGRRRTPGAISAGG